MGSTASIIHTTNTSRAIGYQLVLLQLLSVPKILIYVVVTISTISRDLVLLVCGWHVGFFADVPGRKISL
jgi:hypothetical protein